MQVINEELGIYRIVPGELTMGQIRKYFKSWDDSFKLDELIAFYDIESDRVVIGPRASDTQISFCIRSLSSIENETLEWLKRKFVAFQFTESRELTLVLLNAVTARLERKIDQQKVCEPVPGSKFISIDGDIFQISKIVSVKSHDESGRYYIDFYITSKRASIRKVFATKSSRDLEFQRIQKTLMETA